MTPIASLMRLAHKKGDKSASTMTRNTGAKSNQCWPNGKWQNKERKNSVSPGSLARGLRPKWSWDWKKKGQSRNRVLQIPSTPSLALTQLLQHQHRDRRGRWAFSLSPSHKCWVSQRGTKWSELHGLATHPPTGHLTPSGELHLDRFLKSLFWVYSLFPGTGTSSKLLWWWWRWPSCTTN